MAERAHLAARLGRRLSAAHAWPAVLIYAVFAAMLLVLAAVSPDFPSVYSVTNLALAALPLAFAAVAQTAVVLVKGIDLSVGPCMSLVMVVAAALMGDSRASMIGIAALALLIGAGVGAVNGALVVGARLQPIIVTLATSSVLAGAALYVMPQPGGHIAEGLGELVNADVGPVPVAALLLLAALAVVWLPLRASRIGQAWYAVGGNEAGAFFSGVAVRRTKFLAFVAGGLFSGMGGMVLAAQTLTGDAMMGSPYTLNSIAAAVLGGVSLAGGTGGAVGAVGGALLLTVVVDILFFFEVSAYYQYVITGAILILALAAVSVTEHRRVRRS